MRGERIYKRGNKYYFDITIDGKHYRKSAGANTIQEAINIRDNYLYAIQKKEINNIGNYTSIFNDVVIKFLENKKRTIRERTFELYKQLLKSLYMYFKNKDLNIVKKLIYIII